MKNLKLSLLLLLASIFTFSCSDDDNPEAVNEEEVITTLRLTLTPQGGGTAIVLQSQDLDGDGPNPPVITPMSAQLSANTTYDAIVQVFNELETPADNITLEVAEEDDEHQFFYEFTGAANSSASYTDADADGNPVGITTTISSGVVSTGNALTVTLIHEPQKDAAGVSSGDITNAGGETDVEVTFSYDVN
ncbi:MAG: type 1 periplasmic binding fold superfamily protein [Winogradskyella sp.]|uniref:type 1 periplasmic binding fold superfamily protein n=1 Tax=Winogradskyella sp. TaxID=1883156 RepID=UPI0018451EB5|nr:type 1 periplasmic binding fold superfamily protein [Winogradskyella sp.]MBT8245284.1 type 1 periplasmic binding fold superfamily protein [Winogradskyella sp.]NNK21915.1 type 1 periplasmic binding fold superfamily protein [Winogradskyella sp.]